VIAAPIDSKPRIRKPTTSLGFWQATAISAIPDITANTTVRIMARFIWLALIKPFCIPRSGPMRSGVSLPFSASP